MNGHIAALKLLLDMDSDTNAQVEMSCLMLSKGEDVNIDIHCWTEVCYDI